MVSCGRHTVVASCSTTNSAPYERWYHRYSEKETTKELSSEQSLRYMPPLHVMPPQDIAASATCLHYRKQVRG